jgi:hypothetical protein
MKEETTLRCFFSLVEVFNSFELIEEEELYFSQFDLILESSTSCDRDMFPLLQIANTIIFSSRLIPTVCRLHSKYQTTFGKCVITRSD